MPDDGRSEPELSNIDASLPCKYRHRVIQSTDGAVVISCQLLDDTLGWWHATTAKLCVRCAAYHSIRSELTTKAVTWGEQPQHPQAMRDDPLSDQYRLMSLHPLRTNLPDDHLKLLLGVTRDECIQRAKERGLSHEDILKALIAGVQSQRFSSASALKLADKHNLFSV